MKYLFRLLGVLIAWPLYLLFYTAFILVLNTLSIIFHFNFKHLERLKRSDLYFPLSNSWEIDVLVEDKGNPTGPEIRSYFLYYKTPLDMLTNTLTKVYT